MDKKQIKMIFNIIVVFFVIEMIIIALLLGFKYYGYSKVQKYIEQGTIEEAAKLLSRLEIYGKNVRYEELSEEIQNESNYQQVLVDIENENYEEALTTLVDLKDYKDCDDLYLKVINAQSSILKDIYDSAKATMDDGDYLSAIEKFESLQDYKDSKEKIQECRERIKRIKLASLIDAGTWSTMAIDVDGNAKIEIDDADELKDAEDTINTWTDVVSVSCDGYYAMGLTIDGNVNVQMICENNTKYDMKRILTQKRVIQIASGTMFCAVLTYDGRVITDGKYCHSGECLDTSDWVDVTQIAAGRNFIVGLTSSGELLITGKDTDAIEKQYADNKEIWRDVVKIAAGGGEDNSAFPGNGHVVGLKENREVLAIGDNKYGQCEANGCCDVVDIDAGDWHTSLLLDDNKTVINYGKKDGIPRDYNLDTDEKFISISAGLGYSIYLLDSGKIKYSGFDYNNGVYYARNWNGLRTDSN